MQPNSFASSRAIARDLILQGTGRAILHQLFCAQHRFELLRRLVDISRFPGRVRLHQQSDEGLYSAGIRAGKIADQGFEGILERHQPGSIDQGDRARQFAVQAADTGPSK